MYATKKHAYTLLRNEKQHKHSTESPRFPRLLTRNSDGRLANHFMLSLQRQESVLAWQEHQSTTFIHVHFRGLLRTRNGYPTYFLRVVYGFSTGRIRRNT